MEEIYEFAATQRKLLQGEKAPEPEGEADLLGEDGPVLGEILTSEQDKEQPENAEQVESSGQGRDETPAPPTPLLPRGPWAPDGDQGDQEGALLVTSILLEDWSGEGMRGGEGQGKPES